MLCVQARNEDDTVVLYAAGECGKPFENNKWHDLFPRAEINVYERSPCSKVTMLCIPRKEFLQRVIPVVNRIHRSFCKKRR